MGTRRSTILYIGGRYLIERKTNIADKHHSKIIVVSVNSTRATYLLVKLDRKITQKGGRPIYTTDGDCGSMKGTN